MDRVVILLLGLLINSASVLSVVIPNASDTTAFTARALALVSNVSADNILQILCNAPVYSQNLKVPSCKNVFTLLPKDDKQITFTERDTTVPYDIPLLYRV